MKQRIRAQSPEEGLERTYDRYDLEEEKRAFFLKWEAEIAGIVWRAGLAVSGKVGLRKAIDEMLRTAVERMTLPGRPVGCLLSPGAQCHPSASRGAHDYLREVRRRSLLAIRERFERAIAEGELPAGVDLCAVVSFYATLSQGLGLRASEGVSRGELLAAVDGARAAWAALTGSLPDASGFE